ncbi:lipopolysaccharide assembly protein LapB [Marinoscillum sp. MHG1-6]|uniref:tetratricopeptide repeat protein n=1 Tax=Marinoscillum sp. MHG1-6 TaxID=2959627 RepID=UPI002158642C|nr:tetratricopeptide repeat protein [Marinoscillum sp. MHG1-6]
MLKSIQILLLVGVMVAGVACGGGDTNKGDDLFAKGNYKAAIEAYSQYLESNAADVKTLYNRGRAYQELKMSDLAEKDFMAVIQMDEKNVNARLSLAKLFYSKSLYNKAVLWAEQAVDINENNSQAHFLAARAKHQLGYVDGAMESYSLALKINSDFGEAYLYRGALKLHQGKKASACEDIRKAQALNVKEAEAIKNKYCN